ncbi:hypothetical protein PEC18_37735, partial [Paucibacter sp. O1-1]|nr:hypothetical protein [Paucibacter sp. O1-1]MDA3831376.1 hypothetical protein [Paucibacter sp. O1-1]
MLACTRYRLVDSSSSRKPQATATTLRCHSLRRLPVTKRSARLGQRRAVQRGQQLRGGLVLAEVAAAEHLGRC